MPMDIPDEILAAVSRLEDVLRGSLSGYGDWASVSDAAAAVWLFSRLMANRPKEDRPEFNTGRRSTMGTMAERVAGIRQDLALGLDPDPSTIAAVVPSLVRQMSDWIAKVK